VYGVPRYLAPGTRNPGGRFLCFSLLVLPEKPVIVSQRVGAGAGRLAPKARTEV